MLPVVVLVPVPTAPDTLGERDETEGVEAVELNVELLLPTLGQEVPDATDGEDVMPEPDGLTPEHAKLGTMAGMIETGAEAPVLTPVLATLLDMLDEAVEVEPAVATALPGVTVGAMGIVMGAGKSPVATPAGPPVNALSATGAGGGDKDTTGVTASTAALPDACATPSALPDGDALLLAAALPVPAPESSCTVPWHP